MQLLSLNFVFFKLQSTQIFFRERAIRHTSIRPPVRLFKSRNLFPFKRAGFNTRWCPKLKKNFLFIEEGVVLPVGLALTIVAVAQPRDNCESRVLFER